jgi:hypothetical protein
MSKWPNYEKQNRKQLKHNPQAKRGVTQPVNHNNYNNQMKTTTLIILLLTCLTVKAQNNYYISTNDIMQYYEWNPIPPPLTTIWQKANERELGYRSDGVVVWRMSGKLTNNNDGIVIYAATNYWITNKYAIVMTNTWTHKEMIITNNVSTNNVSTNDINRIIDSGEICKVRGHVWDEEHIHVTLEYIPNRIGCRKCALCKRHENKIAEWK